MFAKKKQTHSKMYCEKVQNSSKLFYHNRIAVYVSSNTDLSSKGSSFCFLLHAKCYQNIFIKVKPKLSTDLKIQNLSIGPKQ